MTNKIDLTQTFSQKESAVYGLLCQNLGNGDIAQKLCMSESNVKYHLQNIYRKLGLEKTDKKDLQLTRQKAIQYSGTKIEQVIKIDNDTPEKFNRKEYFSREEIIKASKRLHWYDQTRVGEILEDLIKILETDGRWDSMTREVSKGDFISPYHSRDKQLLGL